MTSRHAAASLPPSFSVLLDLLRFLAALLVVFGHLTLPWFSKGWPNLTGMAFSMVAVFFVLSGFVISYTVAVKPCSAAEYFTARLARIYSVLVPAVLLTIALDSLTRWHNPDFYNFRFYQATTDLWWRVASVLLFINERYGQDVVLMSNSPIWSLGYEVPYYLVFGIAVFARGWRRLAGFALVLVVWGPNIFVLFPLWLAGCWLHRHVATAPPDPARGWRWAALFLLLLGGWLALPPVSVPALPVEWAWLVAVYRGRSYEFLSFYGTGMVTIAGLLAAWHLQHAIAPLLLRGEKPIRWLAAGSFSLYLYHFPMLVMARGLLSYDKHSTGVKLLLFAVVVVCCYGLSLFTERQKNLWAHLIGACMMRFGALVSAKTG